MTSFDVINSKKVQIFQKSNSTGRLEAKHLCHSGSWASWSGFGSLWGSGALLIANGCSLPNEGNQEPGKRLFCWSLKVVTWPARLPYCMLYSMLFFSLSPSPSLSFPPPLPPPLFFSSSYSSCKDIFSLLLEREGERERNRCERKTLISHLCTHQIGDHTCLNWAMNPQLNYVPQLGIKPTNFQLWDNAPTNWATPTRTTFIILN